MANAAVQDVPWLLSCPGLAGVNDEVGVAALRAAKTQHFSLGTDIVRPGDPCHSFILLIRGSLRVSKLAENGREMILYRVRAGELCVLTLTSLLTGKTYSAGAATEEDTEVAMIPASKFLDAMHRSDPFRTFVISHLSRRMGEVLALLEQVTFRRLDLRLACMLGQLFEQNKGRPIEVTHRALALELGSSREVVSRILKEFELMGCVRLGRGTIELVSSETLEDITRASSL